MYLSIISTIFALVSTFNIGSISIIFLERKKQNIQFQHVVELILKVPFFLTILWDELLSKNLGIFVQSGVYFSQLLTFEGRGCPFLDTFNFWDLVFYE